MNTDQGLSKEWLLGTVVALLLLLINPEEARWRILILIAIGLASLISVGKSQWVKRTNPILTLKGEVFADDGDTFLRKLPVYTFVILAITILGFVTWPSKQIGIPGDGVALFSSDTPPIQYHPTPKGILPNEPKVQSDGETKKITGRVPGVPVKNVKPPAAPVAPYNLTVTAH